MRPVVNGLLKSPTYLVSVELGNVAAKLNMLAAADGNAKPKRPVRPNGEPNVAINRAGKIYVQTLERSFNSAAALQTPTIPNRFATALDSAGYVVQERRLKERWRKFLHCTRATPNVQSSGTRGQMT